MGETHGFQMGCEQLTHPFEWVHLAGEGFLKFFTRLTQTSEWLTHLFEWVHRTTEWVIKFFEQLTRMDEQPTYPFVRLIKICKWVPQMTWTERLLYTDDYLSHDRPSSQQAVQFLLKTSIALYRQ